jgi:hypothetical protein
MRFPWKTDCRKAAAGIFKNMRELGSAEPLIRAVSGNAYGARRMVGQNAATDFMIIGLMPNTPQSFDSTADPGSLRRVA